MSAGRLKCAFCPFSVAAYYTRQDGVRKSGWPRLEAHIEDEHPEEVDRMHRESLARDISHKYPVDWPDSGLR